MKHTYVEHKPKHDLKAGLSERFGDVWPLHLEYRHIQALCDLSASYHTETDWYEKIIGLIYESGGAGVLIHFND